jgi:hypothetical protein
MSEHTPTPWEVQEYGECDDGVGIIGLRTNDGVPYSSPTNGLVAWATLHPTEMDANDPTRAQANAAFIVKAVNSHDALVKALKSLTNEMAGIWDAFEYGLRTENSNTNYAVAREKLAEAEQVLNAVSSQPERGE